MADNFSRQYSHLCPDRVPLFLYPVNECNVPVRLGRARGWRAEGGGRWARHRPLVGQSLYFRGSINSNVQRPQQARSESALGACGGLEPAHPA